jgi:LacI family transcriptional regulator
VEHLIGLGHRRIANLMNELDSQLRRKRLEGYFTALKNAGLKLKRIPLYFMAGYSRFGDESAESVKVGYELAQKMLEHTPEVTGILCMNDMMALGVIKALRENGKRVPADYSIVSFDDLFFADCIEPSLTTMRVEKYQWGKAMARYLFEILENPGVQSCTETEHRRF